MIVCLVLFPSKLHTIFKHSQFYIKFDETYLLGINSSVFFFSFLLVLNRLFFCSNMYKGSVFFSLCYFLPLFYRCVSLSLSFFLIVVIVVVVFISTALRLLHTSRAEPAFTCLL